MRLLEPLDPKKADAIHPLIVVDLIEIALNGHQDAIDSIIIMFEDLIVHGTQSRYAKPLQGMPIWELKTRARGGLKGGARVYWFPFQIKEDQTTQVVAVLCTAEVKPESTPNPIKLTTALRVYLAFKANPIHMIQNSR
jgi:hypothetical protein